MNQLGELPAFMAASYTDALTQALGSGHMQASNNINALAAEYQWAGQPPRRMVVGGQTQTATQTVITY